ncbi:alpha/beta fold hydrolase [Phreatobacter aquaticus]|uniref:Alpha/beta fold hydrolase n=1 Tax=Phreatobacter aquaticus TaxID=2570229 RepID=A0A4D7QA98_9HYPH|nr:alpha/beta fold hydrolase [Phreatobacter aquaticus]QCK85010.1 alpha/beta fold hydrolase [Phreatobacter aquaticus]
MADFETFDLGPLVLQRGLTLPKAHLAYKTYGTLNADKSNVILYPTSYGAHHSDIDWLIGRDGILDPDRWFIVIPNQLGNGLSTSPSNLAEPYGLGRIPVFTNWDNVQAQERLLREVFGVTRLALVYGWSMGGQQALHWGALHPDKVAAICAVCTSARTSPHNRVFLEGIRAVLTSAEGYRDGRFTQRPVAALRAFGRVYAGWAMSQAFYREKLWAGIGFSSLEDYLVRGWEGNFLRRQPEDLISMIDTWIQSDIADNATYQSDLAKALGAITARSIIMPSTTDLYFTVADSEIETAQMPNAELRPIPSIWGHRAGNPIQSAEDQAMLRGAVRDLLGR